MPAYNEAELLARSVTTVAEGMRGRGDPFEIVDGGDHLGGDGMLLGSHAQQDLEQLDGG